MEEQSSHRLHWKGVSLSGCDACLSSCYRMWSFSSCFRSRFCSSCYRKMTCGNCMACAVTGDAHQGVSIRVEDVITLLFREMATEKSKCTRMPFLKTSQHQK